jgi:hypothetical protein
VERRAFLATLGALAVVGCGGGGGGKTTTSKGVSGGGRLPGAPDDAGVLSFILGLEQLQLDLYRRAQSATFLEKGEQALLQTLASHEADHVGKLTGELRRLRKPVPRPLALGIAIADRQAFLGTAYRLENLTAAAYLGQIPRVLDGGVLETVVAIQTVEGRHAAAIGALLGKTPTPDGAFAGGKNMATIALVRQGLAR